MSEKTHGFNRVDDSEQILALECHIDHVHMFVSVYEKQQIENKQAIEKAEADATVKKTEAQAEADAKIITAESEAKANQLLEESLTDSVLKQMYIEKWNGELPKVSSDSSVMIDIGIISD